jgi:hypothetical protein
MLGIDQTILNKIAKSQPMKYKLTRGMFGLPPEVIDEREDNLVNNLAETVNKEYSDLGQEEAADAARRIWDVLPLLLEREALNNYSKENNDLTMFLTTLPTVDNPDQALLLLINEHPRLRKAKNNRKMRIIKNYLTNLPKNLEKNNQSQRQDIQSKRQEHPLKKRARIRIQKKRLAQIRKQIRQNINKENPG